MGLEAVWTARKISLPTGFDARTVQPVASRYTDHTIPAARTTKKKLHILSMKSCVIGFVYILNDIKWEHMAPRLQF